jgi:GDP-4-dehydro-6-deoxy-D-mannose reductase
MKILITGAAGFVGKHLINHIQKTTTWEIIGTKLPSETLEYPNIIVESLDISDANKVHQIIEQYTPEYIIHLAAISSNHFAWKHPKRTWETNVTGTLNLLEAIRKVAYKPTVLLVGSSEEYGQISSSSLAEDAPTNTINPYGLSKHVANQLGHFYAKTYHLNIIMTRSFNHFGPHQSDDFVIASFCKQIAQIESNTQSPIIHVGNLSARRDFTDVRDIVNAYTLLLQHGKYGETYNVGSGQSYSIQTLLKLVIDISKQPINIQKDINRYRPIDIEEQTANIQKITQDTPWKPTIPIKQSLIDTLNYWRDKLS